MSELTTCRTCGEAFEVIEIGGGMTSPEPETLRCPFCGAESTRLARGRLRARKPEPPSGGGGSEGTPSEGR